MKIPNLEESQNLLFEAEKLNPGPWVQHSIYVAQAAEAIAKLHPTLDPTAAYILGTLHDIGRRVGVMDLRHLPEGYRFLSTRGFEDAAQISLTHAFPVKDIHVITGEWDCSVQDFEFVKAYLSQVEYSDYDRLIQLCDALALPTGFCLIEKRLVDLAFRYGVDHHTLPRWKGYFNNQQEFERIIGRSIYSVLPGVIENTFGFNPCNQMKDAAYRSVGKSRG